MKFRFLFLALTGTILVGCNQSMAPKCSAPETVSLVKEISNREISKKFGPETAKQFTYNLQAIRTTDVNKDVGSWACAAQLDMSFQGKNTSVDINYTVEKTDKGDQFYVTILN
ncbi:TPA: hypothetical protein ACX6RX_003186 [Photobacterium damselae]